MTRVSCIAVAVAVVVAAGCSREVKPEIEAGLDVCAECNMVIDRPEQACGFLAAGEFVTFDSPRCLLRNYEARQHDSRALPDELYFADNGDASLHAAEKVTFLLTEHVPTVMESGALCFANRETAAAAIRHGDERLTDWNGYRLAHGTPDRVIQVRFAPGGQVPDLVESSRGELLLWIATSSGFDRELVVSIKGYPEVGEITIPANGEPVVFRMKVDRPGMGFPVMEAGSSVPLGMLRVHGSHTADEEAS